MSSYDFGYPWFLVNGHLIPLLFFGALTAAALWRRWPRWLAAAFGLVTVWALVSLWFLRMLAYPATLPTERFLAAGSGRVLDVGAGSGRLGIGVLLARPQTSVMALDIYEGHFGIEHNTPERLIRNAQAAGVADRMRWTVGDMRAMPFGDGEYDAVVSSYAMDHVGWDGATSAVRETARVLKPGGEFLLMVVNTDWWIRMAALLPHHSMAHPSADAAAWRELLTAQGFGVAEEGTRPATLYFLSRRTARHD